VAQLKMTDMIPMHDPVQKFHVGKGIGKSKRVFISVGPGGKGSEYEWLEPEDALRLAEYLLSEGRAALVARGAKK
jgi:hypothetical protein